jgi:alpha-N-arabinofuranosidase
MHLSPTRLRLDTADVIAPVDRRIFGGLLEHMGRAVYEGVFDPSSRHADAEGLRTDVLEALAALRFTTMRYPGGNFVSGYNWRDGVGPRELRSPRFEWAWTSREPNTFGTDEFMSLSKRMGWTPMMAVNLGRGRPDEARALVEYCNGPRGTREGDRRARNASTAPYGVGLWCLGNEMDGWWQLGHVPADQYIARAKAAAQLMRSVDPSIETIVCGSSDPRLPTYPSWDRTVLNGLTEDTDYLSVHRYARNFLRDSRTFLAFGLAVDRQIEELNRLCIEAQRRIGSAKRMYLSVDEWNVWYRHLSPFGWGRRAPHLLEETYNLEDALVVAGFLNSFIRHADVVKIANLAQIVNVIAPIRTRGDDLLLQSIYYAFRMFSTRRDGVALRVDCAGPAYGNRKYGSVPCIDASAILAPDRLHLFAVNRSLDSTAPIQVELSGRAITGVADAELLSGPAAKARNTFAAPHVVVASAFTGLRTSAASAAAELPPLSLLAASLSLSPAGT